MTAPQTQDDIDTESRNTADARRHGQLPEWPKRAAPPSVERTRLLCSLALEAVEAVLREYEPYRENDGHASGFFDRAIIEERNMRAICEAIGDGTVRTLPQALDNMRVQILGMRAAAEGLEDCAAIQRTFDRCLGILAHELQEAEAAR